MKAIRWRKYKYECQNVDVVVGRYREVSGIVEAWCRFLDLDAMPTIHLYT